MNCYEKYYRRSYNALNKLIDVYKKGYDFNKTENFRKDLLSQAKKNPRVLIEEQNNLIFTILIALLGLNKESMENTGKFSEYAKNCFSANLRKQNLDVELKARLNAFDAQRVKETDFDEWLSIITEVPSDNNNIDHLKRVRNGLLHSNFYIDDNEPLLNIAHIKTKSYYESEVLGPEFSMFVMQYFSNLETLGLAEKMYAFDMFTKKIKSCEELMVCLGLMKVKEFTYDNLKTLNKDTPELLIAESLNRDTGVVNTKKFYRRLASTNNYENFKINARRLTKEERAHLFIYIEKFFGNQFYDMDIFTQSGIISTHLQYLLNPKREVSNWLIHFSYLYFSLFNNRYNNEFFLGDEFAFDSCYPALMILKSYLIMYRMQNEDFLELDYKLLDIDLKNKRIVLSSENLNDPNDKTDYFIESFNKEKMKGNLSSDNEIWNKIVCEVLRNGLAHGNVLPAFDIITSKNDIEIVDIDKKHGTKRSIKMPIEKFEQLLNSEAFNPKNCYTKKDDTITLSRKKSE